MTQLVLLLALSLIGLALSFAFGRMEVRRGSVSPTVTRIEGAVERAALTLLRSSGLRALGLLVLPAAGLAGFALLGESARPGPVSHLGRAAFLVLALLGGAGTALLHARFAIVLGARAASSAAAAVARGSARGVRPLIRAAAATSIFGDGLGLLSVACAFAALYAIRGGFAGSAPNVELAREIANLLPALALGAALTALVLSRDGSVAAAAARVGGGQASEREAALEAGEPRDPSLLATLVGQAVGELLPRALMGYVCGLATTISVGLLAASSSAFATLSSFVLLLLVRAFGVVASLCGVLGARVTDDEAPLRALLRGQLCAVAVALFGLGAATFWQAREHLGAQQLAGALGLLSMLGVSLLSCWPLRRGAGATRELTDARHSGDAAAIVRGGAAGLAALPALLLPALSLGAIERWLAPTAPSDSLAITFAAGALSLVPFAQATAGLGALTGHARGMATLARLDGDTRRRGSKLDDVATLGSALGSTYSSLAVVGSALLGLRAFTGGSASSATGFGALGTALLAGVTLILLFAARAARSALLGARLVEQETERQLAAFPRHEGVATLPADYTPSYKGCVEAALQAARNSPLIDAHALASAPFLIGALTLGGAEASTRSSLVCFAVTALASGLLLALSGRGARALLGELRRKLRGDGTARESSALQAENFGELVGVSAATSVEALALVLALTVLCLAPLMS